ncbi:Beta-catenin-like protein 1 [Trichoplax sp. H2]|uniref:Beta-catenin-like protein 1 n=1 Tax=Trichoplax adhaerens TaxID=10228 RepID=B3RJ00_TRIAD|nr:hypothetical protein TRIADDRAFT_63564 [Trichoplax adhaerens]EDV29036.1 hypothetical protein TRIADDRAFT_63564 [Trichoplax adhaerens]RDD47107.1 Beta-catenin-like protein 1 [Trichoplax sp. H2]|eukprot:XP_002108238.1 hypothetical protein TRIADDRAFT_63564 [Trichoplax adhaerens]
MVDVGELLQLAEKKLYQFEDDRPMKRRRIDGSDDHKSLGASSSGNSSSAAAAITSSTKLSNEERDKILAMLDDEPETESLDSHSLKKLILSFEKKVSKNQEMRIKHPDDPKKFMESEIELYEEIQKLNVIATAPELYPQLVELNTIKSFVDLLTHDNSDISIAIVDLLQEMTDVDSLHESHEGAVALIDVLVENQIVTLLIQNIERLNDSIREEADGVHNTLAIIENLTEFKPELSTEAANQGLMQWILRSLVAKRNTYDANKAYSCEILAVLLQGHEGNRTLLGELEGIDTLLQILSVYHKRDPTTADEIEMLENLFDCLCSSLMQCPGNCERFLRGEGLQLMILMLRSKKLSSKGAIKTLTYVLSNYNGPDCAVKFIELFGLRSLFPLFMKTPKMFKKLTNESEHIEHICSIMVHLFRHSSGQSKSRLANKFIENDFEKVDRLMELHFEYMHRVQECDNKIEEEKRELADDGEEIDESLEEEFYLRRLDAGLFSLHLIDTIMLEASAAGGPNVRHRIQTLLNQHGGSMKAVKDIMREYASQIGDANSKDSKDAEQRRILSLIDRF